MNLSAARADDAVVGNGTGASCTEAAFDAAIAQLYPGATFPGGTITFNCGDFHVDIPITSAKSLGFGYFTVIDGQGVTLDGLRQVQHIDLWIHQPPAARNRGHRKTPLVKRIGLALSTCCANLRASASVFNVPRTAWDARKPGALYVPSFTALRCRAGVDGKDPLDALCPGHRAALLPGAARLVVGADRNPCGIGRSPLASTRRYQWRTQVRIRRTHAMKAREMHAWRPNGRRWRGAEVDRIPFDMCGPVPPRVMSPCRTLPCGEIDSRISLIAGRVMYRHGLSSLRLLCASVADRWPIAGLRTTWSAPDRFRP